MTASPVYYNELDSYCAEWLRNLIAAGLIPDGHVDERSIVDVRSDDLRGYQQCHFFAGIAGWPLALRLAGWTDDVEVWTGSCPCQPLSCAGQRKGHADERHLWPAFYSLIAERKPPTIFGEQVGGKDGLEWLSAVRADLEDLEYAVGAANLPACSVGAPHIRQRLFFVAYSRHDERAAWTARGKFEPKSSIGKRIGSDRASGLEHASGEQVGISRRARESRGADSELGYADRKGPQSGDQASETVGHGGPAFANGGSPWSDIEWLPCIDGKARPIKSGLQPLAHGVPARVGKLRAAGNAIVPQVAAEFIRAAREAILPAVE